VDDGLTVKADSSSVTIYHRSQEIVSYTRSWRRGKTFGAERFERELAEQRPAAAARRRNNASSILWTASATPDVRRGLLAGLGDSDVCCHANSPNCWKLIRQYGRMPWPAPSP